MDKSHCVLFIVEPSMRFFTMYAHSNETVHLNNTYEFLKYSRTLSFSEILHKRGRGIIILSRSSFQINSPPHNCGAE